MPPNFCVFFSFFNPRCALQYACTFWKLINPFLDARGGVTKTVEIFSLRMF